MTAEIMDRLLLLQEESKEYFPEGIFPSYRHHRILGYSRPDDNVYFTSSILLLLGEAAIRLPQKFQETLYTIIKKGREGTKLYQSRLGDVTYNFYRPKFFFPNGNILSKSKRFQPTDDADDTAIVYRAVPHRQQDAQKVKEHLTRLSNGKRNRWIKRLPKNYRNIRAYNTWIGTDKLYVDMDLCVLSNILTFNAQYDLGITIEDQESIRFIEQTILSGDYLRRSWAVSAWYPTPAVIFHQLTTMLSSNYYSLDNEVVHQLQGDMAVAYDKPLSLVELLLLDISFYKLGIHHKRKMDRLPSFDKIDISQLSRSFSYGVIPIPHPFNGLVAQRIGSFPMFQIRYECEAQIWSIILLWISLFDHDKKDGAA